LKIKFETRHETRFLDLNYGDTFRIVSPRSTGSVYVKCHDYHGIDGMLDFTTFKVFPPTPSPVELVDVDCIIKGEIND